MNILDALKSLDAGNDDHWNAAGDPSLKALRGMTGGTVTRKMVKLQAPDLTRDNAKQAASTEPPPTDDSGHGIHRLCAAFAALTAEEIRNNSSLQQVVTTFNHHQRTMMEKHRRNIIKGRV